LTKVASSRFGTLEVRDEQLYAFPEGLPGVHGRRFALLSVPPESDGFWPRLPPVLWAQSLDEPSAALLLVDPTKLVDGFTSEPRREELTLLELDEAAPVCRVAAWTGPEGELLLNLFAPIFFNPARRLGLQVAVVGSSWGTREVWPVQRPSEAHTGSDTVAEDPRLGGTSP
jgi:flagellar assembly factor FliW